ncbi:hypothetical protein EUGRSUZ_D00155 [Eucalyptus grandis]|uniref:Uncharacterized protein n=2 Tax=Eucalyptus TaxID=3932 RepID=A0A059CCU0_EUCGR|nr:hypothetical protein EUGRSUZ_D00155 [Eucalyptus grandis]
MACSRGIYALLALCVLFSIDVTQSELRELRPSDHGLQFQDPPPAGAKLPRETASFFGGSPSSPSSSNPSVPSSPVVPLLNGTNSSDDRWWRGAGYGGGEGGRGRREHVRGVLLVVSIVCGITGAALLFASGLVFLFKFRKQRSAGAAAPPPPPPPLQPLLLLPPPASRLSGDCNE